MRVSLPTFHIIVHSLLAVTLATKVTALDKETTQTYHHISTSIYILIFLFNILNNNTTYEN